MDFEQTSAMDRFRKDPNPYVAPGEAEQGQGIPGWVYKAVLVALLPFLAMAAGKLAGCLNERSPFVKAIGELKRP